MKRENVWEQYSKKQIKELEKLSREYMDFLDHGKTERECVDSIIQAIEAMGYQELEGLAEEGASLQEGDKVYSVWMNKSIVMYRIGSRPMSEGMNILGAHIDSPRLDIKQNPLYEEGGFAYLDTHYYGGVKKYQWVALPLAIHGVVAKKDGSVVKINMGENETEPVFFISDLLPHLAQEQMEKKASKLIEGEALDIIVGSKPLLISSSSKKKEEKSKDEKAEAAKEAVKNGILQILKENFGINEKDFMSAELTVVPAGRAREAGFDRSMILSYGQDDRVCAYTSMKALLDVEKAERTLCCILSDKEEVGSMGATGMKSKFFENTVAEVMNLCGEYSELNVRRCLSRCCMLSSDVSSAYDPSFTACFDKKNVAYLGGGMVIVKFTGSKGKGGSNDANAEYLAYIREILDEHKITFQTAELGKVDLGGGGTIAYILAQYGMNVVDCGVAVMSMHAPWEAVSKGDVYEVYRGYKAFLEGKGI